MNRVLQKKKDESYRKSVKLRNLDLSKKNCSFDKIQEIRKEQDHEYKKCIFFTKLYDTMKKEEEKE